MPDILEQLEAFVRDQRNASKSERDDERMQRIEDKLDQLSKQGPARDRRQLLEELAADESFLAELEQELAGEADDLDDTDDDDAGEEDDEDNEDDEDGGDVHDGIRWRREPLRVPRIYSGDDEPDLVEYLDEDGEVKVRPGRKRGQPVSEEWQEIEANDDEDEEENDE